MPVSNIIEKGGKPMTEDNLKKRLGTENPFRVPDGYFERFASDLMERLPEKESVETARKPTTWEKVRPLLYMAAMFVGAMLLIRVAASHYTPAGDPVQDEEVDMEMEYIDMAMESSMLDDYSLYVYLTEEKE